MTHPKVLIIEDNEGDVDLVREVLAEEFELTWCDTARGALDRIEHDAFDLVLLDQGLPDSNGLALLQQLVARRPSCPVIMLTGREDPSLALSALEVGAKHYLVKNEVLDHLRAVVDRVLSSEEQPQAPATQFMDTVERFYPALLETISEGCVVFDEQGVVTFANGAAQAFASGPLLGTPVLDLLTDETRPRLADALARFGQGTTAVELEFRARVRSAARDVPVRISMHTLHERDAVRSGILVMTDMTEQMRVQELRDDLVRAMLHDLRSPLQAIYSSIFMIDELDLSKDEGEVRDCLSTIGLGTRRLLGLVNQCLDIERFEAGELPLARAQTDLAAQLREAVDAQAVLADEKQLQVMCRVETDDPVGYFDPALLGRVIQNLLGNAIQYSPRGERIEAAVRRSSRPLRGTNSDDPDSTRSRDWLSVSVGDRGPGVAPEVADRIFDKFVRGRAGGSGLGLAFCKLAVEAHQGQIWFEPCAPRGTRFVFEFPARAEG